jgi:hypothetical protein
MLTQHIYKLYNLTKHGKIKGFSFIDNDTINIDILSKPLELNEPTSISISNKNFKKIKKIRPLDHNLISYLESNSLYNSDKIKRCKYTITNKDSKQIHFDLTNHSRIRFVTRLALFIESHTEYVSYELKNLFFNSISPIFLKFIEDSSNIDILIGLDKYIIQSMSNSINLTTKQLYRKTDIDHINKRNHQSATTRITNHPIVFVISNNIVKTCELYSSSFKLRKINFIDKELSFYKKLILNMKKEI